MNVINKEQLRMLDIDDTIVMHRSKHGSAALGSAERWLELQELATRQYVSLIDRITGNVIELEINKNMVRLVKEEHHRGATIIVWSRGGYEWAADVITALGLQDYVHTVMSKPLVYFDDKPVTEWLTDRVYIGPDANYKSNTYKA